MKQYTIVIGNAVPKFNKYSFPRLDAYWEVDNIFPEGVINIYENIPELPKYYPNDFSFIGFSREVGLQRIFYDIFGEGYNGKGRVAFGITKEDADFVSERLNIYLDYKDNSSKNYYYNLEVLKWMEFWMQWAVKNCETPAIQAY